MPDESTCPTLRDGDDEVAKQWVAGGMPPEAAREFESHLASCHRCQRAVEQAAGITAALRTAAAKDVRHPPPPWLRWAIPALAVGVAVLWFAMRS